MTPLLRLLSLEVHHRLNQLDSLNLLPPNIRRFLIDTSVPAGTASLTLVPDLPAGDFWKVLLHPPWSEADECGIDYWILRGEKSVWPSVCLLKVRCAVEVELDRCYQVVRRRKPLDAVGGEMNQRRAIEGLGMGKGIGRKEKEGGEGGNGGTNGGGARRRSRASSVGLELRR